MKRLATLPSVIYHYLVEDAAHELTDNVFYSEHALCKRSRSFEGLIDSESTYIIQSIINTENFQLYRLENIDSCISG